MSPIVVTLGALGALLTGYVVYSRYLSRSVFRLSDEEPVPAVEQEDGVDFVPTRREVLWGHHFASIAGAAPILGPAMAIVWGWLPAMLWIVFGSILMGATHDFGALVLSVRHGGQSVGNLAERFIGPRWPSRPIRMTSVTRRGKFESKLANCGTYPIERRSSGVLNTTWPSRGWTSPSIAFTRVVAISAPPSPPTPSSSEAEPASSSPPT